jgi:hypothetical protein
MANDVSRIIFDMATEQHAKDIENVQKEKKEKEMLMLEESKMRIYIQLNAKLEYSDHSYFCPHFETIDVAKNGSGGILVNMSGHDSLLLEDVVWPKFLGIVMQKLKNHRWHVPTNGSIKRNTVLIRLSKGIRGKKKWTYSKKVIASVTLREPKDDKEYEWNKIQSIIGDYFDIFMHQVC